MFSHKADSVSVSEVLRVGAGVKEMFRKCAVSLQTNQATHVHKH